MRCGHLLERCCSLLPLSAPSATNSSTSGWYHRPMAVIHISRTEAASNFEGLLARVGRGDEIIIDDEASPVFMTRAARQPGRLLSEIIASAEAHDSNATLDGDFGRDLEDFIKTHREPLDPPSWD